MNKIMNKIILSFLIWLGYRSKCCGATVYFDSYNHRYCSKCKKRIYYGE